MPRKIKGYGWIPDLPDPRDRCYSAPSSVMSELPPSVDLRPLMDFEIYNQGELGSCTANAIGAAIQYNQRKQGIQDFLASRLFIYYNERVMLNTVDEDSGAMIRDGIKSVATDGAPPEHLWPYNIAKFRIKPPQEVYDLAEKHEVILYQRVPRDLNQMKGCLASGYPFVFGFTVFPSFESLETRRTGIVALPKPDEEVQGGHAVTAVGYNDATEMMIFRNSYGPGWGDGGYGYLPYRYFTDRNLSNDFWNIKYIEDGS